MLILHLHTHSLSHSGTDINDCGFIFNVYSFKISTQHDSAASLELLFSYLHERVSGFALFVISGLVARQLLMQFMLLF